MYMRTTKMKSEQNHQRYCTKYSEAGVSYERNLWREFPELAEILRVLSADLCIESLSVSTEKISATLYSRTNSPVSKSFRRAEITPAMACSNLSLHEAEIQHPHLFAYV